MPSIFEKGFKLCHDKALTIELPLSKSICIRQLVLQFLHGQPLTPPDAAAPHDVQVTYRALTTIYRHLGSISSEFVPIHVCDCGTAYRFLMALLAITPGRWLLSGNPRLLQRPIKALVDALQSIGADIQATDHGWLITGRLLTAHHIAIDGSKSSQYISALLLIAPFIGNPKIDYATERQPSSPYIKMTESLIRQYRQQPLLAERDWSAALFWYAFCAAGAQQPILLKGLSTQSLQGDAIIADWFTDFGVYTIETDEGILLRKSTTTLREEHCLTMADHPDLAPILTAMATLLPIRLTLTGLRNLDLKESKRRTLLVENLSPIANITAPDDDTLIIKGTHGAKQSRHLHFDSHDDHRLVMAFALTGLQYSVSIDHAACVNKSYPLFEEELKKTAVN